MKFSNTLMKDPNLDNLKSELNILTSKLENATSLDDALKTVHAYFKIIDAVDTQMQLVID